MRINCWIACIWMMAASSLAAANSAPTLPDGIGVDDRDAVYPLTIDPTFAQQAHLKAANTGAGDQFGGSVAASGDIVAPVLSASSTNAFLLNIDISDPGNLIFSATTTASDATVSSSSSVLLRDFSAPFTPPLATEFIGDLGLAGDPAIRAVGLVTSGDSTGLAFSGDVGFISGNQAFIGSSTTRAVTPNSLPDPGSLGDIVVDDVVIGQWLATIPDFTFPAQDDGTDYSVTVLSQPSGPSQTCSVINGSGTLAGADVSNVIVSCETDQFVVVGVVTGLTSGSSVTLINNGGDEQIVNADGPFIFSPQLDGTSYNVTVQTQPSDPSLSCIVTNGIGTFAGSNVTDVAVDCVLNASISILPQVLDFGDLAIGVASASQMIIVESAGPGDLLFDAVSVLGPHAADFAIVIDSCSGQLLPVDDFCGIEVVFTPSAVGLREAWLVIDSNAVEGSSFVDLLGTSDVVFFDGFEQD